MKLLHVLACVPAYVPLCVCVCVCARARVLAVHSPCRPPHPLPPRWSQPTLFLTPMHYPLLPTRPDEKQAPCCNSENFKSKRFRRGSRGQGAGGGERRGVRMLPPRESRVKRDVLAHPPSIGLRHPSLEKSAGKRCSELVEELLYVQRNRRFIWNGSPGRSTSAFTQFLSSVVGMCFSHSTFAYSSANYAGVSSTDPLPRYKIPPRPSPPPPPPPPTQMLQLC